ncbi:MAG: Gfo/Idh/MocA family protein, partial [Planctomycetota bacterium]
QFMGTQLAGKSIGIVGLGWWACDVHIPNLLRVEGAEVAALCSRSGEGIERGRAALEGRAEPATFRSYKDLLASDAAEAVVICTPNFTHGPMALQALRAGKHVYVEKPLATAPEQCPPVVAEAEGRGLVVQVGVELRCSDVATTMRRLIDAGTVGDVALVHTNVWREWGAPGAWRADDERSGGQFHELGIHYIDLLGFLAGAPPSWAVAAGGSAEGVRDFDHGFTTIGYEGGAVGSFGMCLFAAGGGQDITLDAIGTEGRVRGEIMGGTVELWHRGGEPEDHSPERGDAEVFGFPGSLECARGFVECVRTGERPSADAAEGERLCRVCEAARLSAARGGERVAVDAIGGGD